MSAEHAAAYEGAADRIAVLAASDGEAPVPATPGWSVQDVVSHLAGLAADWGQGRLEGYASAAWTARHVEMRADWTLDAVLDEWVASRVDLLAILHEPHLSGIPDPLMTAFGPVAAAAWPDIVVTDIALHEHDIRAAVGVPGARGSDAVRLAMRSHVGLLRFVAGANDLPALLLESTDGIRSYAVGRSEPEVVLQAPHFELFRATGGRRSMRQMAAMAWTPDPGPWLDHLVMPSYAVPEDDLVE